MPSKFRSKDSVLVSAPNHVYSTLKSQERIVCKYVYSHILGKYFIAL